MTSRVTLTREAEIHLVRMNGAVYTPEKLSQYVAQKTLEYLSADPLFVYSKKISIADPACGEGMLLGSIAELLLKDTKLNVSLCGIDIDARTIRSCEKKLHSTYDEADLTLIHTNALHPFDQSDLTKGWKLVFEKAGVKDGFDVLIANPPWGADLSRYKGKLSPSDFRTLQGQVDSFELFMELALRVVKKDGYFAFIVPDSILNHGKSILRDILVSSVTIKFVARLGEKIFPGINRACVVIICKNALPSDNDMVDCFRLSRKDRNGILAGELSFAEAELAHGHKVPQTRFATNVYKQFDIDLRENETQLLNKFMTSSQTLGGVLSSERGVELGKSGMVTICNNCKTCAPLSEKTAIRCNGCGKTYNPLTAKKERIIFDERMPNSAPMITGGDLRRYSSRASRWIVLSKKGINYKPSGTYAGPKILVRKTGVGLTAALDYSSAYTNQVVYILKNKKKTNPDLEFFIALVNSRSYYFILMKSFGELEWRSHPYLTQSQILSLPLPDIESEKNRKVIDKIVSLLKPILRAGKPSMDVDLKVELLIGKLFSLNRKDYEIIFNAINESEELIPVRDLKYVQLSDILKRLDE